ncbi:J domain-containing protein [Pedomonas mirosovicensis]|uniref:J domain-containing protein n=1 Tax=Pedomonas mirosovicensis TaxID=2908641 RepID=UPI002166CF30|nr:DnaJ family molecular chaperone [Pedomonas mirosovicensis]MCH8684657.1 DnaJ family molecular chaperone [Pedomonas mirosovicensis]
MSIWGKLIGGAAGLAIGGPIGALIGIVIGHAMVDVPVERWRTPETERRQVAFTIAAIALAAKMARADGHVDEAEFCAFRRLFRVKPEEEANVVRFYRLAQRSTDGFEAYARQAAQLFGEGSPVLEDLLDALFLIAKSDGYVTDEELAYLETVARLLGFRGGAFARIRSRHLPSHPDDPYVILGVEPGADLAEVRAAYRQMVKEHHPDRHIAAGVPPEFIRVAEQRMAAINAAYRTILAQEEAA